METSLFLQSNLKWLSETALTILALQMLLKLHCQIMVNGVKRIVKIYQAFAYNMKSTPACVRTPVVLGCCV